MAAKGRTPVSFETKQAAFALRLRGLTNSQIGTKLNLHPVTVSRIFTAIKKLESAGVVPKEETKPPSDTETLRDWRQRLTVKSVKALDRGLDDPSDNYKAGGLGRDVLKGLGELQGDGVNVHVQALIASVPPEWRDRYTQHDSGPRMLSAEQHEVWALEVFRKSSLNAVEFSELRREARAGRTRLVSNDDDWNAFFEAETARANDAAEVAEISK
jgi:hypothetical protein